MGLNLPTIRNEFDSNVMEIEISGSDVKYRYYGSRRLYVIRGMSFGDLARLRQTQRNLAYSSSATVQYQTHLYRTSHYDEHGDPAPPAKQPVATLKRLTPYRG